ncbi:hypothetical protein [Altericista sp. CCNU0014]|uniref:hypothetical protein n=1 Tax=Altericista sp. CCNU0014 TaxID=3082949 RepID=UPI00385028EB
MALEADVKKYIACWMQLGKKVWINAGQSFCLAQTVLERDRYSPEFEQCWAQITDAHSNDCYLDGTTIDVKELLSDSWEIVECARCDMPISLPAAGLPVLGCPCNSLPNWPNTELPLPRAPVNSSERLLAIQKNLTK